MIQCGLPLHTFFFLPMINVLKSKIALKCHYKDAEDIINLLISFPGIRDSDLSNLITNKNSNVLEVTILQGVFGIITYEEGNFNKTVTKNNLLKCGQESKRIWEFILSHESLWKFISEAKLSLSVKFKNPNINDVESLVMMQDIPGLEFDDNSFRFCKIVKAMKLRIRFELDSVRITGGDREDNRFEGRSVYLYKDQCLHLIKAFYDKYSVWMKGNTFDLKEANDTEHKQVNSYPLP